MTYPFRVWVQDIGIWSTSTDLQETQVGAAIAGRLGGVARAMAREMPIDVLRDGQMLQDGTQLSGMQCLLRALSRRFAPLSFENCFTSMCEFLQFRGELKSLSIKL